MGGWRNILQHELQWEVARRSMQLDVLIYGNCYRHNTQVGIYCEWIRTWMDGGASSKQDHCRRFELVARGCVRMRKGEWGNVRFLRIMWKWCGTYEHDDAVMRRFSESESSWSQCRRSGMNSSGLMNVNLPKWYMKRKENSVPVATSTWHILLLVLVGIEI
jgi:hypothetical protein